MAEDRDAPKPQAPSTRTPPMPMGSNAPPAPSHAPPAQVVVSKPPPPVPRSPGVVSKPPPPVPRGAPSFPASSPKPSPKVVSLKTEALETLDVILGIDDWDIDEQRSD